MTYEMTAKMTAYVYYVMAEIPNMYLKILSLCRE